MQERRRYKRLDIALPVTLRHGGRLIPATTLNLSSGGVCLSVSDIDISGKDHKKVEVVMDLSQNDKDVALRGELVRIGVKGEPKLGIKFTNLYTTGHQTLERFLNNHLN